MRMYRCHLCKDRLEVDKLSEHFPICSGKIRNIREGHAMTSEDSEVTESLYEDNKPGFPPNPRRSRRRRTRRGSKERPKTATLPHPNILDETLKDKVDMTLTKKDLLAAVKLCQDPGENGVHANTGTRTASNLARLRRLRQYSSNDETGYVSGSSSGSAEQIYLPPKARRTAAKARLKSVPGRPMTSRLEKPSHSDIEVPNIRYYSKPKGSKARLHHKMKTEARKKLFALPLPTEQVLEPCLSCGRTDQPERLHTHRLDESKDRVKKGKSPLKEAKETNNIETVKVEYKDNDEDKKTVRRLVGPRSLSPKKQTSPEKSISPGPALSDSQSPRITRKPKLIKSSEKENDLSEATKSPRKQKTLGLKTKVDPKINRDFTVDIFTSKSFDENEESNPGDDKLEKKEEKKENSGEKVISVDEVLSTKQAITVKCKTCGKEFGRASIKFHEPQCEKKRQAELGRKQKEIEALEEKPVSYMDHIDEDETLTESFNEIWEAHMQQLLPCTLCSRTFFPDRLEVHRRSCKGLGRGPKTADAEKGRKGDVGEMVDGGGGAREKGKRGEVVDGGGKERGRRGKLASVPEQKISKEIPIQYFISK